MGTTRLPWVAPFGGCFFSHSCRHTHSPCPTLSQGLGVQGRISGSCWALGEGTGPGETDTEASQLHRETHDAGECTRSSAQSTQSGRAAAPWGGL